MGYNFTQKQCISALTKIGFTDASKRRAKHFKYRSPKDCKVNCEVNTRPFIIVPKHKFYCQDAIVEEIEKLCGKEMKQNFLNNL